MSTAFEDAEDSPGFLLWQTTNMWQREMRKALEPFGLTHPQFVLLFSCHFMNGQAEWAGRLTQVQLAQNVRMDVNVTSQVLRKLEQQGFVRRGPHPTDTRAHAIAATPAGSELANRAVQAVEAADRAFFSVLGTETRELLGMLTKLAGRRG
ncbi:MarR family transcriptional regulator [Cohnella ginsengisoli]|uniref:MarR family transcriptional regulator n=1 Tax=Cohnella ginsengisoli TaxID=425004 RepID=A0A9X4KL51_9BACL|nr:MarR family transcriptional regulator [Cohnella ginsengisoli]MDG0794279.1 MarR family transcriptional regulator [Cohnella ginsengisoli]